MTVNYRGILTLEIIGFSYRSNLPRYFYDIGQGNIRLCWKGLQGTKYSGTFGPFGNYGGKSLMTLVPRKYRSTRDILLPLVGHPQPEEGAPEEVQ